MNEINIIPLNQSALKHCCNGEKKPKMNMRYNLLIDKKGLMLIIKNRKRCKHHLHGLLCGWSCHESSIPSNYEVGNSSSVTRLCPPVPAHPQPVHIYCLHSCSVSSSRRFLNVPKERVCEHQLLVCYVSRHASPSI